MEFRRAQVVHRRNTKQHCNDSLPVKATLFCPERIASPKAISASSAQDPEIDKPRVEVPAISPDSSLGEAIAAATLP
eukprot:6471048-Amphidinium_carterae.2